MLATSIKHLIDGNLINGKAFSYFTSHDISKQCNCENLRSPWPQQSALFSARMPLRYSHAFPQSDAQIFLLFQRDADSETFDRITSNSGRSYTDGAELLMTEDQSGWVDSSKFISLPTWYHLITTVCDRRQQASVGVSRRQQASAGVSRRQQASA